MTPGEEAFHMAAHKLSRANTPGEQVAAALDLELAAAALAMAGNAELAASANAAATEVRARVEEDDARVRRIQEGERLEVQAAAAASILDFGAHRRLMHKAADAFAEGGDGSRAAIARQVGGALD